MLALVAIAQWWLVCVGLGGRSLVVVICGGLGGRSPRVANNYVSALVAVAQWRHGE